VRRDLILAWRRRADVYRQSFFCDSSSLFPEHRSETQLLRSIAPGVVWVAALLASMLSLDVYCKRLPGGTLEQMLLTRNHSTYRAGEGVSVVLVAGVPLALIAPVLGCNSVCRRILY